MAPGCRPPLVLVEDVALAGQRRALGLGHWDRERLRRVHEQRRRVCTLDDLVPGADYLLPRVARPATAIDAVRDEDLGRFGARGRREAQAPLEQPREPERAEPRHRG